MPDPIRNAPAEDSHRPLAGPTKGKPRAPARVTTAPARRVQRMPNQGKNSLAETVEAIGHPTAMAVRVRPETTGLLPSTAWT